MLASCAASKKAAQISFVFLLVLFSIVLASCGSGSSASKSSGGVRRLPHSDHVYVLMEENHAFSEVFPAGDATDCSSSGMPYLCGLAAQGGIATNFYSDVHGSLWGYLDNTSGEVWAVPPFNCNGAVCAAPGAVTGDNIVRALTSSGKTWRGYFEDMPSPGYTGGNVANYVDRHNPFKWYSDVTQDPAQQNNMVPFTQLSADIAAGNFPNFGYIVPNVLHDGHGTGNQPPPAAALMAAADSWMQTNIAPLLASPPFQAGGDGVLIITFDESALDKASGDSFSDAACSPTQPTGCGGHIPLVIIGPLAAAGSTATATYHFADMLHTIITLLGLPDYMNQAATASDIPLF
jgi:phosphatidylinositol-3-phosphatase